MWICNKFADSFSLDAELELPEYLRSELETGRIQQNCIRNRTDTMDGGVGVVVVGFKISSYAGFGVVFGINSINNAGVGVQSEKNSMLNIPEYKILIGIMKVLTLDRG